MDAETRSEIATLKTQLNQQAELIADLRLSRAQRTVQVIKRNKRLAFALISALIAVPVSLYALSITKNHTFTAGNPTIASEVNANFDQLFAKVNDLAAYHPPVGTILAWHKSFPNTPILPLTNEWVECNGQLLIDAQSPYNNQTIPNLNGSAGGADSPGQAAKVAMFLRGGGTSGTGQQDAFQGWQAYAAGAEGGYAMSTGQYFATSGSQQNYAIFAPGQQGDSRMVRAGDDGTNGTPRTANETRPVNMSVVWIMKVK